MGLLLPPSKDDRSPFDSLSLSPRTRPHSSTLLTDRQFSIPSELLLNRPRVEGSTIDDLRKNAQGFVKSPDRDDAIGLRADGAGWIVDVTISDVEWLVKRGTDVAELGLSRGVTNYRKFPYDHMYPTALAEEIFALGVDRERPSITVSIPFTSRLQPGQAEIYLSKFQATEQLDYGEVGSRVKSGTDRNLVRLFNAAHSLSLLRNESGFEFGNALLYGLVQNEDGKRVHFDRQRAIGSFIVQEFMIATNHAVASMMVAQDIPGLYRNQGVIPQWNIEGPLGRFVNGMSRRAHYSPECLGHLALGLEEYTHFSSPIRRGPDAIVQANVKAHLQNEPYPYPREELREIGARQTELSVLVRFPRTWRMLGGSAEGQFGITSGTDTTFGTTRSPNGTLLPREVLSFSEAEIRENLEQRGFSFPEIVQILFRSPKADPIWAEIRKDLAFLVIEIRRDLVRPLLDEAERDGFIRQSRSPNIIMRDGSKRARVAVIEGEDEYVGIGRGENAALKRAFIKLFFKEASWSSAERGEDDKFDSSQTPSRRVKTPFVANSSLADPASVFDLHAITSSAKEAEVFEFLQNHSISFPCNYLEMLKEGEKLQYWSKFKLFYDKYTFFGDDCLVGVRASVRIGGRTGSYVGTYGFGLDQRSASMAAAFSLLKKLHVDGHVAMRPEYLALLDPQAP